MTRRFEVGPVLVAIGAIALLASLFLEWYGPLTAWDAFEVVEVLLMALALGALAIAVGQLAPEIDYVDRRWLPAVVVAAVVLVVAEIIDPPPAATGEELDSGAWIAFAAVLLMILGAVLTFGRVRFAVSVEGRTLRERVPVVDHRQDTTEAAAVSPEATDARPGSAATTPKAPEGTRASE